MDRQQLNPRETTQSAFATPFMDGLMRLFPVASIGTYLAAIAAFIAVPLILFVAFLMAQLQNYDRKALIWDTVSDAKVFARVVESRLQDMKTLLRLLAIFPELENGELEQFQNRTQGILARNNVYLIAVDEEGQQLINTRVPFGTPLGPTSNRQTLDAALASGLEQVSDIFYGRTGQRWVFNVILPLPDAVRGVAAALILTQDVAQMQGVLNLESLTPGWSAAVLDQSGQVIASGGPQKLPVAERFPVERLSRFTTEGGAFEYSYGGETMISGYSRVANSDWIVTVWGPVSAAQEQIVTTWRWLILGGLGLIALSILLAYAMARQLSLPVRQIAESAERLGRGEVVSPVLTKLSEANQVSIALANASFDRSEAEERILLMLRELVHRSKNILALVQAIIRQLSKQNGSKEAFQKALESRLAGLARSVELLAQENWAGSPLHLLVDQHLSLVGASGRQITVEGTDLMLSVSAVQNLGLVLHELATNSIKYGALSVPDGSVSFTWRMEGEVNGEPALHFLWQERGGPPVAVPQSSGFGSSIIKRHAAAAFNGVVDLSFPPSGIRWSLKAPLSALRKGDRSSALDQISESLSRDAAE